MTRLCRKCRTEKYAEKTNLLDTKLSLKYDNNSSYII
jgi:hypothetical protein